MTSEQKTKIEELWKTNLADTWQKTTQVLLVRVLSEVVGRTSGGGYKAGCLFLHLCALRQDLHRLRKWQKKILLPRLLYRGALRMQTMTEEQSEREEFYQASMNMFLAMHRKGLITREQYPIIVTKMREKYRFEKENIDSLSGDGEVVLTLLASFAQEESRSISENCTWGQRKRMSDGKVSVVYSRFLGYDKGPDGRMVVNPGEAVVVRDIYDMFPQGLSYVGMAKKLTERGIKTPGGKDTWGASTVSSILSNEKYKGTKSLTVDYLTKKVNEGETPQYYVEGNHEAIISPEKFDMVRRGESACLLRPVSLFPVQILFQA